MQRPKTLEIEQTSSFGKVEEFLNVKSRRSQQTKKSYLIALAHFQTFLTELTSVKYDIETILPALIEKKIDIYSLLNQFVDYLLAREPKLSPTTILFYIAGVKSYLEYYDVEISSKKFRHKVTLPDRYRGNIEAIDAEDIRTMLLGCTIPRLKAFILVLASSGMRALEACSLKINDIDFSSKPTKVHLRAENTKTKQGNDIYISDEATKELSSLVRNRDPNGLLFTKEDAKPGYIYKRLQEDFAALLKKVGMDKRKDSDGRRVISFHSFRRFVKTTISNAGYGDYSEWMLGHRSTMAARYYYTKEQERKEIYLKVQKYLTFLDYPTVDAVGKDFESKLAERDQEIKQLRLKSDHLSTDISRIRKEADLFTKSLFRLTEDYSEAVDKMRLAKTDTERNKILKGLKKKEIAFGMKIENYEG